MQRIRPAVEALSTGIGVEYALASKRLYTDGAEVLYDYASSEQDDELRGLTVVRTRQRQFAEVVRDYLKRTYSRAPATANAPIWVLSAPSPTFVSPWNSDSVPVVAPGARLAHHSAG